jgi:hypothetical protein
LNPTEANKPLKIYTFQILDKVKVCDMKMKGREMRIHDRCITLPIDFGVANPLFECCNGTSHRTYNPGALGPFFFCVVALHAKNFSFFMKRKTDGTKETNAKELLWAFYSSNSVGLFWAAIRLQQRAG